MAKTLILDNPGGRFHLWSLVGKTYAIKPLRGTRAPHVCEIREQFLKGKRWKDLQFNEMAIFDDHSHLLENLSETGLGIWCVHVDGDQGLRLRHLRRLVANMNPTSDLDEDDVELKRRVLEDRARDVESAKQGIVAALTEIPAIDLEALVDEGVKLEAEVDRLNGRAMTAVDLPRDPSADSPGAPSEEARSPGSDDGGSSIGDEFFTVGDLVRYRQEQEEFERIVDPRDFDRTMKVSLS